MIRTLNIDEIPSALRLAWEVFEEFEAPDYSDEGVKTFRDFINDETQIAALTFYGAFCESELAGIIAMRGESHISMFFVKKEYHRQGYGRKLFEIALQSCKARNTSKKAI
jgi:GNAT superfamily N-acetyltransferase